MTTEIVGPILAIPKIRHWNQHWDPKAPFVWRRRVRWDHKRTFQRGESVPPDLIAEMTPSKLRRLWVSSYIQRADIDSNGKPIAPGDVARVDVAPPAPPTPVQSMTGGLSTEDLEELLDANTEALGGGWIAVRIGEDMTKVRGPQALHAFLLNAAGGA